MANAPVTTAAPGEVWRSTSADTTNTAVEALDTAGIQGRPVYDHTAVTSSGPATRMTKRPSTGGAQRWSSSQNTGRPMMCDEMPTLAMAEVSPAQPRKIVRLQPGVNCIGMRRCSIRGGGSVPSIRLNLPLWQVADRLRMW